MLQIISEACRDTIASTTCKQTIAIKLHPSILQYKFPKSVVYRNLKCIFSKNGSAYITVYRVIAISS